MPTSHPAKRDPNDLTGRRVALYCRVSQDDDGDEKSVDDQEAVGLQWVERHGAALARCTCGCGGASYRDSDFSASRFATRERKHFTRLLADIQAGKLDAVWFWELSRSQRRLAVFADLADRCRDRGVLWVIRDRVYDPGNYADRMTLGMLSVIGEMESELTSERTRRGVASNIAAGRPHGRVPYGYKRFKDPITGRFDRQEPDVFDGDGHALADSPAWVVREVFARFVAGTGIRRICHDLQARGVPSPGLSRIWAQSTVRKILLTPTYAGLCVHRGEIQEGVMAQWPPVVDLETFWAARRILLDPARRTGRPSNAKHLLSYLVRCDECDALLACDPDARAAREGRVAYARYACFTYGCRRVSIRQLQLDEYVEEVVIRWASRPDVYADLTAGDGSAEAAQARADAEQLRADLAEWRAKAKAGEVKAAFYAEIEADRLERIAEAEQRERAGMHSPALAEVIGPDAAARWDRLDLAGKRQILREIADIRIRRVGKGQWRNISTDQRVKWRWLLGPGSDEMA